MWILKFDTTKIKFHAQNIARSHKFTSGGNIKVYAGKVYKSVQDGWGDEGPSVIQHKYRELIIAGLPKHLRELANKKIIDAVPSFVLQTNVVTINSRCLTGLTMNCWMSQFIYILTLLVWATP